MPACHHAPRKFCRKHDKCNQSLPLGGREETRYRGRIRRGQFTCTLLAHLRKLLIINGAGEGNRTHAGHFR
jgi:hypothetical protein